jgi:hypothetical protein
MNESEARRNTFFQGIPHRDRRSRTQEALQTDVDGEHVDLSPTENHRVQESPYTRVTFLPDYARFGMETLDLI